MFVEYINTKMEKRATTNWRNFCLRRDEKKRENIRRLKEKPPKLQLKCEYLAKIDEGDLLVASEIATKYKELYGDKIDESINQR